MKFFLCLAGVVDHDFGIMTSPGHKGVVQGIKEGMDWAADNNAFKNGFDPGNFFTWLRKLKKYRTTCLFVTCPDKVADAEVTIEMFRKWRGELTGWPVAFVGQDGQEDLPFPGIDNEGDNFDTLFIGGSTEWKENEDAISVIKRGQELGKHIHIGRVNYIRRYNLFKMIKGSQHFTCDGTRNRFVGKDETIRKWRQLQNGEGTIGKRGKSSRPFELF